MANAKTYYRALLPFIGIVLIIFGVFLSVDRRVADLEQRVMQLEEQLASP